MKSISSRDISDFRFIVNTGIGNSRSRLRSIVMTEAWNDVTKQISQLMARMKANRQQDIPPADGAAGVRCGIDLCETKIGMEIYIWTKWI